MATKSVYILMMAGVMLFGVTAFAQESKSIQVREQSKVRVSERYRAEVKTATSAGQNIVDAKLDQDRDRRMDGSGDKAQDRDQLRDHDQTKDQLKQQDRDRLRDNIGSGFGSATRSGKGGSKR